MGCVNTKSRNKHKRRNNGNENRDRPGNNPATVQQVQAIDQSVVHESSIGFNACETILDHDDGTSRVSLTRKTTKDGIGPFKVVERSAIFDHHIAVPQPSTSQKPSDKVDTGGSSNKNVQAKGIIRNTTYPNVDYSDGPISSSWKHSDHQTRLVASERACFTDVYGINESDREKSVKYDVGGSGQWPGSISPGDVSIDHSFNTDDTKHKTAEDITEFHIEIETDEASEKKRSSDQYSLDTDTDISLLESIVSEYNKSASTEQAEAKDVVEPDRYVFEMVKPIKHSSESEVDIVSDQQSELPIRIVSDWKDEPSDTTYVKNTDDDGTSISPGHETELLVSLKNPNNPTDRKSDDELWCENENDIHSPPGLADLNSEQRHIMCKDGKDPEHIDTTCENFVDQPTTSVANDSVVYAGGCKQNDVVCDNTEEVNNDITTCHDVIDVPNLSKQEVLQVGKTNDPSVSVDGYDDEFDENSDDDSDDEEEETIFDDYKEKEALCDECLKILDFSEVKANGMCLRCELYLCSFCINSHKSHLAYILPGDQSDKTMVDKTTFGDDNDDDKGFEMFLDELVKEDDIFEKLKRTKVTLCARFDIHHPKDIKECWLRDLDVLQNGEVVLTDSENNCIKLLDRNYTIKRRIELTAWACGIVEIVEEAKTTEKDDKQETPILNTRTQQKSTENPDEIKSDLQNNVQQRPCVIAFTCPTKNAIIILDITDTAHVVNTIYVEKECYNLLVHNGIFMTICIGAPPTLHFISKLGEQLKVVELYNGDERLHDWYPRIALYPTTGTIYLSSYDDNLVLRMDSDGHVLNTMSHENLLPYGLAVDEEENVFLCSEFKGSIYKLSKDLKVIEENICCNTCEIGKPAVLGLREGRLYVSSDDDPLPNTITVLKLE